MLHELVNGKKYKEKEVQELVFKRPRPKKSV